MLSTENLFTDKRIHKPLATRSICEKRIRYSKAVDFVNGIKISKGERYFSFVSGNFIFGDLIEAYIVENNLHVKKLTISTLSMSKANVDSLKNLLVGDYVDELNLIVSDYFFSVERHDIVKYIYSELDIDNKFQLSVCRSHTKITTFETYKGFKYVMHGSANLRSSDNIEQVDIEENENLYDYIDEFHSKLIDKYKSINKSINKKQLWLILENQDQEEDQRAIVQQKKEHLNVHNKNF